MSVSNLADHGIRQRGYYVQANSNPTSTVIIQQHDRCELLIPPFHPYLMIHVNRSILHTTGQHDTVEVDTLLLFRHMMIDVNCVHVRLRSKWRGQIHVFRISPPLRSIERSYLSQTIPSGGALVRERPPSSLLVDR